MKVSLAIEEMRGCPGKLRPQWVEVAVLRDYWLGHNAGACDPWPWPRHLVSEAKLIARAAGGRLRRGARRDRAARLRALLWREGHPWDESLAIEEMRECPGRMRLEWVEVAVLRDYWLEHNAGASRPWPRDFISAANLATRAARLRAGRPSPSDLRQLHDFALLDESAPGAPLFDLVAPLEVADGPPGHAPR